MLDGARGQMKFRDDLLWLWRHRGEVGDPALLGGERGWLVRGSCARRPAGAKFGAGLIGPRTPAGRTPWPRLEAGSTDGLRCSTGWARAANLIPSPQARLQICCISVFMEIPWVFRCEIWCPAAMFRRL